MFIVELPEQETWAVVDTTPRDDGLVGFAIDKTCFTITPQDALHISEALRVSALMAQKKGSAW